MEMITYVYIQKWLYLFAICLVIVGGMNWGAIGFFNINIVEKLPFFFLIKMIYILVGISALYLVFDRNTYLPFLGDTVYPCNSLADKVPDNATISQTIQVPPNSKVVYWASEHSDKLDIVSDPWSAYMNYANTGVVTADVAGKAILKVRPPSAYKVPTGRIVDKHIHYRYCKVPGMLSQIYTIYL